MLRVESIHQMPSVLARLYVQNHFFEIGLPLPHERIALNVRIEQSYDLRWIANDILEDLASKCLATVEERCAHEVRRIIQQRTDRFVAIDIDLATLCFLSNELVVDE